MQIFEHRLYCTTGNCVYGLPGEICIKCEECGRVFFNGELSYQPPEAQPSSCPYVGGVCCWPIEACWECPNHSYKEG